MKLSIITIAYNNLAGLEQTYRSIRSQTFRDFEWIVVDGGSSDGTREFLQAHDAELAFWCSEPDKGVYNAQNKGTQRARGEYCIFMNSGDTFFADDVLQKVFSLEPDADVVYGDWMLVFENGRRRLRHAPETVDMAYFFDDNMCHQAMFIRTEALRERPYDESFPIYADWEEWLALLTRGKRFEHVDQTVCCFMVGGLSTGGNASPALLQKRQADIRRIQARYYDEGWQKALRRVMPLARVAPHLQRKRRKHNVVIRLLIGLCTLLLLTNIATILLLHSR